MNLTSFEQFPSTLLDGTRLSDGAYVALKIVRQSENPEEVEIAQFLTSEPLRSDCSNHCVPVYDTLPVPDDGDLVIMVMPLLRSYTSPAFYTVGEVMEYLRQVFEVTIVLALSHHCIKYLTSSLGPPVHA